MYIMTLKMKFIQGPRLEFFEKKSSRFIIVIIYIYIIYLIGLNLCPTLCLVLCPIFPIPKNIIHLTYRVMSSLNILYFVFDFVSRFVSHFVSEPISKRNFIKKTFPNRFKAAECQISFGQLCIVINKLLNDYGKRKKL